MTNLSERLPDHLRLEFAEMAAGLANERAEELQTRLRNLEADLRGQIHRLRKQLHEQDEFLNETCIEARPLRAGGFPLRLTLRTLFEMDPTEAVIYSWQRCSVPGCTDPVGCWMSGEGRH